MSLPNEYALARLVTSHGAERQFQNLIFYLPQGAPGTLPLDTANGLATEIESNVAAAYLSVLPPDCRWEGVYLTYHINGEVYTAISDAERGPGDSENEDALPNNDAVCIRKFTATAGRTGLGRWFIPFVPENLTDDNYLTVAGGGLYIALAGTFLTSPNVGDVDWTPCHNAREEASSLKTIVGTLVDRQVKRQDRRSFRGVI